WPGDVLRFAMLRTHYRQPIDWTVRALEEAEQTLASWTALAEFGEATGAELAPEVLDALTDDLNTPKAIVELHALERRGERKALAASLHALGFTTPLRRAISIAPEVASKVEDLISVRRTARATRNWAESDRIRDELKAMGIVLHDNKDGTTTWEVAP
ncbi:MAG TPA: cysteine--tRNA ligase, partial [Beijerinckiaceae bacterium]|nr:cysteine--tRNA ligase [Beijerinckiaceae bacterium]